MKKLTILLFSIFISLNSYGESSTKYTYYGNGQKESVTLEFIANGNEYSEVTYWYKNGQILLEESRKDGEYHGSPAFTYWNKYNQITIQADYIDGVCISGDC